MDKKLLALLETKFKGVRKDGLQRLALALSLTVGTDEEATAAVEKLTQEAVDAYVQAWRSATDAEVGAATKTHEDNLKKKYTFVDKEADPNNGEGNNGDDLKTLIAQAVAEATKPLAGELETLKSGSISSDRRKVLDKELDGLPSSFRDKALRDFDRMSFDNQDSFATYLEETKTDIASFKQELADKGLSNHDSPIFGSTNKDGVSAGVAQYVDNAKAEGNALGGKEI